MPSAVKPPKTLYDKVFADHIVDEKPDGTILLYIGDLSTCLNITPLPLFLTFTCVTDRHLVHEVTSPVSEPRC